jgi:hypothetical protein
MTLKQRIWRIVASWLFDAANPIERAQRPMERRTIRGLHEELNPTSRVQLASDSRKLFSNLGPAKAAIVDKAVYSFGRAWAPQFAGEDAEWGQEATRYLVDEFYPQCDLSLSAGMPRSRCLWNRTWSLAGRVDIFRVHQVNNKSANNAPEPTSRPPTAK